MLFIITKILLLLQSNLFAETFLSNILPTCATASVDHRSSPKNPFTYFDFLDKGTSMSTEILSKGPNLKTCSDLFHVSCASMCASTEIKAWTCVCCKSAHAFGYEVSSLINNERAQTRCLITVNEKRQEIAVAFRGTMNVINFLYDANALLIPVVDCEDRVAEIRNIMNREKVHRGFYRAVCSVYHELKLTIKHLLKKHEGFKVAFTGHSLGSAMASVAAYMLMIDKVLTPNQVVYCGSGGPRVGNRDYADWWNGQPELEATRVVHMNDPIPHIFPSTLGYVHHGVEVWFDGDKNITCSRKVYEDPNCSNSDAPFYNFIYHTVIWDLDYNTCALYQPLYLFKQMFPTQS